MKRTVTNFARVILLITVIILFVTSCSDNPISTDMEFGQTSFTSDEINWIPWKPEYLEKKNSLNRVYVGRWIWAYYGGTVGGWNTFYNLVTIPPRALTRNTFVSVEVLHSWWCHVQTAGGVEFLPNMQFRRPVTISLSYEYLDYAGDHEDLAVYWSNDNGNSWNMIDEITFYPNLEIATFETDHFTIFAWGE